MIDVQKCRLALQKFLDDKWSLHVPPQEDDPDIVLSRAIDELERLQSELDRKIAVLQVYADDSNWSSDWSWKGINDPTVIAKRELGGSSS